MEKAIFETGIADTGYLSRMEIIFYRVTTNFFDSVGMKIIFDSITTDLFYPVGMKVVFNFITANFFSLPVILSYSLGPFDWIEKSANWPLSK